MLGTYRLPEGMRSELAKPLGKLFLARDLEGRSFARAISAPAVVVSVGDRVTETVAGRGRVPEVQVVDGKENRRRREPPDVHHVRTIRARNPPGTITQEAMKAVKEAFGGRKPARVLVRGEEDMLTIPAVIFAPISSCVFYGQPGVGIVMVRVTNTSKARSRRLLERMEAVKSRRPTANL